MPHVWPFELQDGDLLIRPLQRRDRRAYEALRRRNRSWLAPWDATDPATAGSQPDFAAVQRWNSRQGREGTSLGLVIAQRGALVGQISAGPIQYGPQSSAAIGYWVDRGHAGQGVAPRATALLIDHCFAQVGLHRIEVNVRPENHASIRVAQKLHLREEGLRRRYIHVDGAWRDHISFALTVEDVLGGNTGRGVLTRFHREFPRVAGAS